MAELSDPALTLAVQAVAIEMQRIRGDADVADLGPDDQELLLAYSRAAMDLKAACLQARQLRPRLPAYETLIGN
jgi:hypothetical protein